MKRTCKTISYYEENCYSTYFTVQKNKQPMIEKNKMCVQKILNSYTFMGMKPRPDVIDFWNIL